MNWLFPSQFLLKFILFLFEFFFLYDNACKDTREFLLLEELVVLKRTGDFVFAVFFWFHKTATFLCPSLSYMLPTATTYHHFDSSEISWQPLIFFWFHKTATFLCARMLGPSCHHIFQNVLLWPILISSPALSFLPYSIEPWLSLVAGGLSGPCRYMPSLMLSSGFKVFPRRGPENLNFKEKWIAAICCSSWIHLWSSNGLHQESHIKCKTKSRIRF